MINKYIIKSDSFGYSLIELMVSMVVSLILGLITMVLFVNLSHQSMAHKDVADIDKTTRTSLFLISRDLANAGYLLNCTNRSCGALLTSPPTTTLPIEVANAPQRILIHYGASKTIDPISVYYDIDNNPNNANVSSLHRIQVNADGTTNDSFVASNVVDLAWQFSSDNNNTGMATYEVVNGPVPTTNIRSIKIGLLVMSALPDKKYISPQTINWLGGSYAVPVTQMNYRFKVIQEEVILTNTIWTNP